MGGFTMAMNEKFAAEIQKVLVLLNRTGEKFEMVSYITGGSRLLDFKNFQNRNNRNSAESAELFSVHLARPLTRTDGNRLKGAGWATGYNGGLRRAGALCLYRDFGIPTQWGTGLQIFYDGKIRVTRFPV